MGVNALLDPFNRIAAGHGAAQRAQLSYGRQGGAEHQILTFFGVRADGSAFEFSHQVPATADPRAGALDAGQAFVNSATQVPAP